MAAASPQKKERKPDLRVYRPGAGSKPDETGKPMRCASPAHSVTSNHSSASSSGRGRRRRNRPPREVYQPPYRVQDTEAPRSRHVSAVDDETGEKIARSRGGADSRGGGGEKGESRGGHRGGRGNRGGGQDRSGYVEEQGGRGNYGGRVNNRDDNRAPRNKPDNRGTSDTYYDDWHYEEHADSRQPAGGAGRGGDGRQDSRRVAEVQRAVSMRGTRGEYERGRSGGRGSGRAQYEERTAYDNSYDNYYYHDEPESSRGSTARGRGGRDSEYAGSRGSCDAGNIAASGRGARDSGRSKDYNYSEEYSGDYDYDYWSPSTATSSKRTPRDQPDSKRGDPKSRGTDGARRGGRQPQGTRGDHAGGRGGEREWVNTAYKEQLKQAVPGGNEPRSVAARQTEPRSTTHPDEVDYYETEPRQRRPSRTGSMRSTAPSRGQAPPRPQTAREERGGQQRPGSDAGKKRDVEVVPKASQETRQERRRPEKKQLERAVNNATRSGDARRPKPAGEPKAGDSTAVTTQKLSAMEIDAKSGDSTPDIKTKKPTDLPIAGTFSWADVSPASSPEGEGAPDSFPASATDKSSLPVRGVLHLPANCRLNEPQPEPDRERRPRPRLNNPRDDSRRHNSGSDYHSSGSGMSRSQVMPHQQQQLVYQQQQQPRPRNQFPPLEQPAMNNVHIPPGSAVERLVQDAQAAAQGIMARFFAANLEPSEVAGPRQALQYQLEAFMLRSPGQSLTASLDQLTWRCVFYNLYEALRHADQETAAPRLVSLLDDAAAFYARMVGQFTAQYRLAQPHSVESGEDERKAKFANLLVQRFHIALGDLARYKAMMLPQPDYGLARSHYMKAARIAPKNSHPYNQLGILAYYTKRKLETVYYYIRALSGSNPILTVKEKLVSIFQGCRDDSEKEEFRQRARHKYARSAEARSEVWRVVPGSEIILSGAEEMVATEYSQEADAMALTKLTERFVTSLLRAHGTLFSRVGLDTFPDTASRCQHELAALLRRRPLAISDLRLQQLTAISVFSAWQAGSKQATANSVSELYATQFLLDTLAQLCVAAGDQDIRDNLLSPIRIIIEWLLYHADTWNPAPMASDPAQGPNLDAWTEVAALATVVSRDETQVVLEDNPGEGLVQVRLGEDDTLAGFTPLSSLGDTRYFSTADTPDARTAARIDRFSYFADYLCGIEPAVLKYDVASRSYLALATTVTVGESTTITKEAEATVALPSDSELRLRLVVEPRFLVVDTNCYVDYLPKIRALLALRRFTLVLPLTVLNELEGLAQGRDEDVISARATEAIDFIRAEKDSRNIYLRVVTAEGSSLDTLDLRTEKTAARTNDDRILSACLGFVDDRPEDKLPRVAGEPVTLTRNVVLLTADLNLQLKAHIKHVPTVKLPRFANWLGVS